MAESLPYTLSPTTLTKVLDKIKSAATPSRFTADFLANTLGMKGGTPRAVIPYLKRIGFLATDGSPTELYKRFRNPAQTGAAAVEGLATGYRVLFAMNENAHTLSDGELKGLVVQATGLEDNSRTVQAIVASFKALKQLAKGAPKLRDMEDTKPPKPEETKPPAEPPAGSNGAGVVNLSYTINLNLPATSDVAVFNAIFRSLQQNLLRS
jgi:hypothetical protein